MSRIESLTPAQVAQLADYREKWLSVGLSTLPADKASAVEGVKKAYKEAGFAEPKMFIWLGSPLAGAIGATLLSRAAVAAKARVGAQVGDQVRAQVWARVWDQVGAQVWDQVGDQVYRCCYGHQDAGWVGFFNFFDNVVGLQVCKRLDGIRQVTESAGWWWPFEGLCILTERPVQLHRDDRNRLHCENGMSIKYPDGWGIYAWHGVRLQQSHVITNPEQITVVEVEKESNVEVRRVMVERMGYERYVLESGAQMIHSDDTGALYRKEMDGDEPLVVVHVVNSTPEPDGHFKKYMLRVPPTMTRARQAVAWTFDMPENEYAPLIET